MSQMLLDHGADPSIGKVVDSDSYVKPPHNIFEARYQECEFLNKPYGPLSFECDRGALSQGKKAQLTLTRRESPTSIEVA